MPNNPKCIIFKMATPPTDEQVQTMVDTVPFATNCVSCSRRKDGKLEKMCWKGL